MPGAVLQEAVSFSRSAALREHSGLLVGAEYHFCFLLAEYLLF
jgi:hypothetical protein